MKKEVFEFISSNIKDYTFCDFLTESNATTVLNFIKTHNEYKETPLISLNNLAERFNVSKIYIKDESKRMGLNAFKGVGVLYGVVRIICKKFGLNINEIKFENLLEKDLNKKIQELTFIAATDGNHGKGLAWVSKQLGCSCHIYVPKNTTQSRIQAIENFGATVTTIDGNYDETLKFVIDTAQKNNWEHVQDQAWEGYTKVTNFIAEGYTIIAKESLMQMNTDNHSKPTHIFLQAGAGTFALGIMGYYANIFPDSKPYMAILEPKNANCYFKSIKNNTYSTVEGELSTVMAGLSVGEANIVAWDNLKTIVNAYASCDDSLSARGMRILANPLNDDSAIISGESGALGLGFLSVVCDFSQFSDIRQAMGLNEDSVILVINTEGDTDPTVYEDIIWNGAFPL